MPKISWQIGTTPNPNAIRVGLSDPLFPKATTVLTAEAAGADPLVEKIFAVKGVKQIFLLNNFLTITKDAAADWAVVEPAVAAVLAGHFDA